MYGHHVSPDSPSMKDVVKRRRPRIFLEMQGEGANTKAVTLS